MNTRIDVVGEWWLPADDTHKVAGWFTYDPETGGTLRLNGELHTAETSESILEDGTVQHVILHTTAVPEYPVIYGEADNKCYTLFDAFQTNHKVTWPRGKGMENVYANVCIEAHAWFPDKDDLDFDRLIVSIRHLTEWVDQSGLQSSAFRPSAEDTSEFARISAYIQDRQIPSEPSGDLPQVTFVYNAKETGNRLTNLILEQRWDARLIAHPARHAFEPLIDAAIDLQRLVTIAVGATAVLESVKPQHPELIRDPQAETPRRLPINYHARWSTKAPERDPISPLKMYFTLNDLGGIDVVQRWLTVAAHYRSELGRIMATRTNPEMYLEDEIANLCAALESIDKVRRNAPATKRGGPTLRTRITETITYAGGPFHKLIPQGADTWAREVVRTRNDIDHHNEVFRTNETVGEAELPQRLYWLLIITLLRLAEAPEAVLSKIADHQQNRHLREKAHPPYDQQKPEEGDSPA